MKRLLLQLRPQLAEALRPLRAAALLLRPAPRRAAAALLLLPAEPLPVALLPLLAEPHLLLVEPPRPAETTRARWAQPRASNSTQLGGHSSRPRLKAPVRERIGAFPIHRVGVQRTVPGLGAQRFA